MSAARETRQQRLVVLYQEIADHTKPECARCFNPYSCCDSMYCNMATEYAEKEWGVDLTPLRTGHDKLPYMGPEGCVVAPHLRPLCALHTCQVNGVGFKPGDDVWNEHYFKLREEIEDLESQGGS